MQCLRYSFFGEQWLSDFHENCVRRRMFLTNLNVGTDESRPSFFEIIAHSRLMDGLKPAFKSLLLSGLERWPSLLPLVRYNDEVFHFLLLVLERHYLQIYDGSFSENFFGLKRMRLVKENQTFVFKALKDSDRRRALLSIVGFPYLQSVLDRQYTLINEENTSSSNQHVHLKKIKAIFKTVYPIFDTMTRGLKFVYMFLFLFEFTGFFSPWLHLTRQQFRRMSMQDIMEHQKRSQARQMAHRPRSIIGAIFYLGVKVADYFKFFLLTGIFVYKFFEWWYASEEQARHKDKLPIPPPPKPLPISNSSLRLPASKKICPLCLKYRTNPACLPSGYVFCYPCIYNYVSENRRCPITDLSASVDVIRTIFESE